jgi:hypothetical protein
VVASRIRHATKRRLPYSNIEPEDGGNPNVCDAGRLGPALEPEPRSLCRMGFSPARQG